MKLSRWLMFSLVGLTFPVYAFATTYNYLITATDVFGDIISGNIVTDGQVGPLGTNSSTFVNNGILQSFNLTGTGPVFNNTMVNMDSTSTFPPDAVYYSGLGTICALPGGAIGTCDLTGAPTFNQTIFNFATSPTAISYASLQFTYWTSYPSSGLPTWTVAYSDPTLLTTSSTLFTSFTSELVTPNAVPEPSEWLVMLFGLGLIMSLCYRHRKVQRNKVV